MVPFATLSSFQLLEGSVGECRSLLQVVEGGLVAAAALKVVEVQIAGVQAAEVAVVELLRSYQPPSVSPALPLHVPHFRSGDASSSPPPHSFPSRRYNS